MVDINTIDEQKTNDMLLEADEERNAYDLDTDGVEWEITMKMIII